MNQNLNDLHEVQPPRNSGEVGRIEEETALARHVQPGRDEDPSILLVEMAMLAMLLRKYKYLVSVDTKDPTDLRDVKYIRDFTSEINPSIVVVI
jgi:hypothetical protein